MKQKLGMYTVHFKNCSHENNRKKVKHKHKNKSNITVKSIFATADNSQTNSCGGSDYSIMPHPTQYTCRSFRRQTISWSWNIFYQAVLENWDCIILPKLVSKTCEADINLLAS